MVWERDRAIVKSDRVRSGASRAAINLKWCIVVVLGIPERRSSSGLAEIALAESRDAQSCQGKAQNQIAKFHSLLSFTEKLP